jgi:hypothetical protein
VDIRELVVSKRITREPRDYQKAGVTAIVAQQLFGSGVKLRPGQNIEYVITNAEAQVPNDRVRAYALWEGWLGYDRKKYAAMLREAFEPFQLCIPKRAEPVLAYFLSLKAALPVPNESPIHAVGPLIFVKIHKT